MERRAAAANRAQPYNALARAVARRLARAGPLRSAEIDPAATWESLPRPAGSVPRSVAATQPEPGNAQRNSRLSDPFNVESVYRTEDATPVARSRISRVTFHPSPLVRHVLKHQPANSAAVPVLPVGKVASVTANVGDTNDAFVKPSHAALTPRRVAARQSPGRARHYHPYMHAAASPMRSRAAITVGNGRSRDGVFAIPASENPASESIRPNAGQTDALVRQIINFFNSRRDVFCATAECKYLLAAIAREYCRPGENSSGVAVLVLAVNRESVGRIVLEIERLTSVRVAAVHGGAPRGPQIRAISRGARIVVGTPGRLDELVKEGFLRLDHARVACIADAELFLPHSLDCIAGSLLSRSSSVRLVCSSEANVLPSSFAAQILRHNYASLSDVSFSVHEKQAELYAYHQQRSGSAAPSIGFIQLSGDREAYSMSNSVARSTLLPDTGTSRPVAGSSRTTKPLQLVCVLSEPDRKAVTVGAVKSIVQNYALSPSALPAAIDAAGARSALESAERQTDAHAPPARRAVLVIAGTKRNAEELTRLLRASDCPALLIHNDKPVSERAWVLNEIRTGRNRVLVCTELGLRELSLERLSLSYVISMDIPQSMAAYSERVDMACEQPAVSLAFTAASDPIFARRLLSHLQECGMPVDPVLRNIVDRGS